jgi:hypothetical protein
LIFFQTILREFLTKAEEKGEMEIRTRMVVVIAFVSLLLLPASVVAQGRSDVEVTDLQWTHDVNNKLRLKGNYRRSPAPAPDFIQEVSANFRNVGVKPIKSVTWEYVVYEDSDPAKVLRVYKFRSKTLLRPNESTRLSKQGLGIQHRRHIEVYVVRVEYSDGTFWQRGKV